MAPGIALFGIVCGLERFLNANHRRSKPKWRSISLTVARNLLAERRVQNTALHHVEGAGQFEYEAMERGVYAMCRKLCHP